MDQVSRTLIAAPGSTSAGFSKAKSPATCRSTLGPNSNWSSISPPQRHSASKSHRRCSHSPTRSSNDHKDEAAQVHHAARRCGCVAADGAGAVARQTADHREQAHVSVCLLCADFVAEVRCKIFWWVIPSL